MNEPHPPQPSKMHNGSCDSMWQSALPLIAKLHAFKKDGLTTVIKVDGERDIKSLTVILSGGALRGDFFHEDTDDLTPTLAKAIEFYIAKSKEGIYK